MHHLHLQQEAKTPLVLTTSLPHPPNHPHTHPKEKKRDSLLISPIGWHRLNPTIYRVTQPLKLNNGELHNSYVIKIRLHSSKSLPLKLQTSLTMIG
jgi:hypothetical protein